VWDKSARVERPREKNERERLSEREKRGGGVRGDLTQCEGKTALFFCFSVIIHQADIYETSGQMTFSQMKKDQDD